MDSKTKPDDWLAAYEAAKQKALQNLDRGKLQSVTGISGFCGKIKNVDHLSSNYNVTKLLNAMKDGKIKKKTVQNGGIPIESAVSKSQREKARKKRRNAKRREDNAEADAEADAMTAEAEAIESKEKGDNMDTEVKKSKGQRARERKQRRKKELAAQNAETEGAIETEKSPAKTTVKKSKYITLAQKTANQAIADEMKNKILELQMTTTCDIQVSQKSSDSQDADKNKPSKYAFKKFEFKPKAPKQLEVPKKVPSSNGLNGLNIIASNYDTKNISDKVKIAKDATARKSKCEDQGSIKQNNDKKIKSVKDRSARELKSDEEKSMNKLNSTAQWLVNLGANQNCENKPDTTKHLKLSITQARDTTNDKKRKIEEEQVSSKRIKSDVNHMSSLGVGRLLKEIESNPDFKKKDCKSSAPDTLRTNTNLLVHSKVNDHNKTENKVITSNPISQHSQKNNNKDSWLAAYEAKKQAALKNMEEGKLQSVVGISAFYGKNDQDSNFSKTNQVTKLMDKFKHEELKPIKKQFQPSVFNASAKINPPDPSITMGISSKPVMAMNSPKSLMAMNIPPKPSMTQNNKSQRYTTQGLLENVRNDVIEIGENQWGNGWPVPLPKNNSQGGAQTGPSAFDKKPPPPPDRTLSVEISDSKPVSSTSGLVGDSKPFSSIGSIRLSDNFVGNSGKTTTNVYSQNYQSTNFGMGVGNVGFRGNVDECGDGKYNMNGWNSMGMTGAIARGKVNSIGMRGGMTGRSSMEREGNSGIDNYMRGGLGESIEGGGYMKHGMSDSIKGGLGSYMRGWTGDGMEGDAGGYISGAMGGSMERGVGGHRRAGMCGRIKGNEGMMNSMTSSSQNLEFGTQYGQYGEQDYDSTAYSRCPSIGTPQNSTNNWMCSGENNNRYGQNYSAENGYGQNYSAESGYGQNYSDESANRTIKKRPTVAFGKANSTQLFQWIKPS